MHPIEVRPTSKKRTRPDGTIHRQRVITRKILRLSLCLSLSLILLFRLECLVEAIEIEANEEKPIVVGDATYYPPNPVHYGQRVGTVLIDFITTKQDQNKASIELVDWYQSLGQAHFDDAIDGIIYENLEDKQKSPHANLPENYYLQLSLHAYEWASKALFQLVPENTLLQIDPLRAQEPNSVLQLQQYATIEYDKGGVFASMARDETKTYDSKLYSSAVDSYRKSKTIFDKLRYASFRKHTKEDEFSDQIDAYYANSCLELANLLYSQLILAENEEVDKYNEQLTGAMKAQAGDDLDIVQTLMDQANGFQGLYGMGDTFTTATLDALQGNAIAQLGGHSETWNDAMAEVTELMDTAILTYHQHANPQRKPVVEGKEESMKVIVNGVVRKSLQELQQEEHLFPWKVSLATAYQEATTVASTRNQLVRARELMRLALQVYSEDILPYYQEQSSRQKRLSRINEKILSQPILDARTSSTMTKEYAQLAIGALHKSLADTDFHLGSYQDSKDTYAKCMDWFEEYQLAPEPDEKFNIFIGDEVGRTEYKEFVAALHVEMEQYQEDVRAYKIYQDDNYEGNLFLSMLPVYLAMGDTGASIHCCQQAIVLYERITKKDPSNQLALLNLADARFGLATAYFHEMQFSDSQEQHALASSIYQQVYGEGNPPKTADEAALEEMKDEIIKAHGQYVYDQLQSYYDGKGADGSKPQVAVDVDFFQDNETDAFEDYENGEL